MKSAAAVDKGLFLFLLSCWSGLVEHIRVCLAREGSRGGKKQQQKKRELALWHFVCSMEGCFTGDTAQALENNRECGQGGAQQGRAMQIPQNIKEGLKKSLQLRWYSGKYQRWPDDSKIIVCETKLWRDWQIYKQINSNLLKGHLSIKTE